MKPANKMTDFADWKRNLARDVLELDSDYDSEDEPEYDADPDMEVLFEDYMMPAVSAGKIDRINHILASFDIDEAMLSEIYGGSTQRQLTSAVSLGNLCAFVAFLPKLCGASSVGRATGASLARLGMVCGASIAHINAPRASWTVEMCT